VTPAWRDAHLHLAEHGEALSRVDLSACASIDDVLGLVREAASDVEAGAWLRARSLQPERLAERRFPTAAELDDAAGPTPCVLTTLDLHSMAVNTAAMRAAGVIDDAGRAIDDDALNARLATLSVSGKAISGGAGVVERDDAGNATGALLESATALVHEVLPTPTERDVRGFVRTAIADLRSCGVVEAHEMFARRAVVDVLVELDRAGELDGFSMTFYATRAHFEAVREALTAAATPRLRLGGVKLFVDGTLNSRTAWMLTPFADPVPGHACGIGNYSVSQILDELRFAEEAGVDVAAHAIGDAAVRALLDAYEAFEAELGREPNTALRIEHAQFVDDADIERFARRGKGRGVVASVQPCHLLADIEAARRLLPDRAERMLPLRRLLDANAAAGRSAEACVWMGSDAPVVPPRVEDNRQAAVERRRADMPASAALGAAEAMTEDEWAACQASPAERA
jgi:hypothetical protein